MFSARTLLSSLLLSASLFTYAANDTPSVKETTASVSVKKAPSVNYTIRLDNTVNKNRTVDSVLVILDKFDRSGAGIVTKVFYPDANNQIIVEDLPVGKYYAEIYVLGLYKKHFSAVITNVKTGKKNKASLHMDYKDLYVPGSAQIPAENLSLFAFNR